MDQETRISRLEDRVNSMEKEIVRLRKLLSLSSNVSNQNTANLGMNTADTIIPATHNLPAKTTTEPIVQDGSGNGPIHQNTAPPLPTNPIHHTENKLGLEGAIGKNVIGIMASILIFIAFLLFGSLIYKQLDNAGKAILLFISSGAILGVGLLLQKKLSNTFSLSVIGCGMGSIYISLIVSNVYFHFLSAIPLYMILLFWLLGMSLLCRKYESMLLCIIGQCGLYLAVLFGIISVKGDAILWLSVFVFFMIANIFYFRICNLTQHRLFKNFTYLFSMLCLLIIAVSNIFIRWKYMDMHEGKSLASGIFLFISIFLLGYLLYQLWKSYKSAAISQKTAENLIALGTLFTSLLISDCFFGILSKELMAGFESPSTTRTFNSILTLLFSLGLLLFTEYYVEKHFTEGQKNYNCLSVPSIPYLTLRSMLCLISLHWHSYNLLLVLIIPLLFYGFYKNKEIYKCMGIFVLFIQVCIINTKQHGIHMLLTTAAIFFAFWLLRTYSSKFYTAYKITFYTICLLFSMFFTIDLWYILTDYFAFKITMPYGMLIYFVLITPLQILALKTKFCRDWRDLSKSDNALYYYIRIVNICLLYLGTELLYDTNFPFGVYILLVLFTSALCFTGLKELLKYCRHKYWVGFYIGIKITVYVSAVLESTPYNNGIFLSILLLLIAILSILFGFKYKLKSFRLYGLFLTMLSVVKLILLDIHYSNMMGTIIAFMVCGILCFFINFIYNILSQRLNETEDEG